MIAIVSDLHCGSKHALCPPSIELSEEATYQLTKTQEWLWQCWLDFCKSIPAGSIGIVNGDIIQGTHANRDGALVSYREDDQQLIAVETLKPFLERCADCYITYGTEWHESISGQSVVAVVRELKHDYKIHEPRQELWLEWNGKTIHVAHHRSISNTPAGKGTPLAQSLNKMIFTAPMRKGLYPDIVIRSHAHDPGYLWTPYGLSIGLPAWQMKGSYVWRTAPESVPGIGGIFLTWDKENSRAVVVPKIYQVAQPQVRQLLSKS